MLEFEGADGSRAKCRARLVLACDGTSSTVRRLSTAPAVVADRQRLLIDEGKSVWRGIAPIDARGRATFYKGEAGQSALLFPAGRSAGSCWTVTTAARANDLSCDAHATQA